MTRIIVFSLVLVLEKIKVDNNNNNINIINNSNSNNIINNNNNNNNNNKYLRKYFLATAKNAQFTVFQQQQKIALFP